MIDRDGVAATEEAGDKAILDCQVLFDPILPDVKSRNNFKLIRIGVASMPCET